MSKNWMTTTEGPHCRMHLAVRIHVHGFSGSSKNSAGMVRG